MKIRLSPVDRTLLLQQPIATPTLLRLKRSADTVLVIRVAALFSFRHPGLPITARAIGYQAKEGLWVVAVAFRIAGIPGASLEDVVYLNPRCEADSLLLQSLATQERLPFLFLSPRLKIIIEQEAPWSVHHRQEVRLLLAQLAHTQTKGRLAGEDDEFVRARQEFQQLYPISTLLAAHPRREVHVPTPFRGVVLE